MGIELSIRVTTPQSADDHDMLTGVSIMLLAIANRPLATERFPEAFESEGEAPASADDDPRPCGAIDGERVCVAVAGHDGEHRFRPVISDVTEDQAAVDERRGA